VLLLDPVTALGEPAGPRAADIYNRVRNVTVRTLNAAEDPVPVLAAWASGR